MRSISIFTITILLAVVSTALRAVPPGNSDAATSGTAVALPAAGTTRVVDQNEIERILSDRSAELTVVNFWATFCGPCVEEMPYFVRVAKENKPTDVRVIGISVDLKAQIASHVEPFLKKREIPYPNVVFYGDQEKMINFFAPEWSGELPVTFIYDKSGKQVAKFLRALTYEELTAAIAKARTAK